MIRIPAFDVAGLAFAQRVWLAKLQAMQPYRAILTQVSKETVWRPVDEQPFDAVLWTRSVLLNEIVADADSDDPAVNADLARRFGEAAVRLGAVPLVTPSGGRGSHAHVYFDPSSLLIDLDLQEPFRKHSIDPWKIARETVRDAIVKEAGFKKRERDAFDDGKVSWTALRKGSMVRDFGSTSHRTGARKSLLAEPGVVVFPDAPPPTWTLPPQLAKKILKEWRVAAEKAAQRSESPLLKPDDGALARLEAHPCVQRALTTGAPVGQRGTTALHLARLARHEGLVLVDAYAIMRRYGDACARSSPQPMTDDLGEKLQRVYAEPVPPAIACPNPLKLAVCEGCTFCPKRQLKL